MLKLVDNPGTVLTRSYAVWLAIINIVVFVADHMEMLDAIPQQYRTTIQAVLLAAIPIARIIKQQSLQLVETGKASPTTTLKE